MATTFTAHLTAFARPASQSYLAIKTVSTDLYRAPIMDADGKQAVDDNGDLAFFESNMALIHGVTGRDAHGKAILDYTPVSAEMLMYLAGRAMMVPFRAARSDDHSYGFAGVGISSETQRRDNAQYKETARQAATISSLQSQGIEAEMDVTALQSAADQAAKLPGGGGYGLIFETPLELWDGKVCNVFISLKALTQLTFIAFRQSAPMVYDQTLRHLSSGYPLKERTAEMIMKSGFGGAIYQGFATKDGKPFTTNAKISDLYAPWQNLANDLSIILAKVGTEEKTTAIEYIRPETLAKLIWEGAVEIVPQKRIERAEQVRSTPKVAVPVAFDANNKVRNTPF